ncbi:unnamed protein product [Ilex paraguariensis]|uniref:Uncharacterized protein n=1 Tax=Ilex paraguariensis TaxID=185542 RepID=A0ABC8SUJ7_9AQUA
MEDFQKSYIFSHPSSYSQSSSSSSNQHPLSISAECWLAAENFTQQILFVIQPTIISEHKRMQVIHYVQKLLRDKYGIEVRNLLPYFLPKTVENNGEPFFSYDSFPACL